MKTCILSSRIVLSAVISIILSSLPTVHRAFASCAGGGCGGNGSSDGGACSSGGILDKVSPTPFSLSGRPPGSNGVPVIHWADSGINARWTTGPYLTAAVNGSGHGTSVHLGSGDPGQSASDFTLPLNGIDWSHVRTYSSLSAPPSNWQGEGWWSNEMAFITVAGTDGSSNVTVTFGPHFTLNFAYDFESCGFGGYCPPDDNYPSTLTFVGGSDEYRVRRADGMLWVFHDAGATNAGKLKIIEDAYGNDLAFTYSSGKLTDIVVDVVEGSDHKITYTYFTSGDNNGKLQFVKVYKTTTTTDANLIGKVEYVYHDSTSDSYGLTGDLMKVIVSRKATTDGDGTLSIEDTYRYRYWKGPYNSSTNPGADHQLRYVLNPENADRLGSPETKTNTQWETYTNVLYEYDSNSRIRKTEERLPGSGCGCSGGGNSGTTTYTWTVNSGTPNLDTWKIHCVADREDSSRVIFDANRRYDFLTWVVQDAATPTRKLIWHMDYGTSGVTENRLTQIHYPSACSDYNESTYAVTLRTTTGLIYELDYDYTGFSYDGYPERIRVKQGTSGTADTLIAYGRTISLRPDLITSIIHYESAGEADGRTTSLTYTFYDTAKYQPKQLDITYPSVSAGKNGPGSSAVEKRFFDKRTGALRWTLDGEGFVDFHAYDLETGVENLEVDDANTSTLMTVIDNAWDGVVHGGLAADDTVPFSRTGSGTAMDIDSSSVIDWLGRTRKETDAGGMITYHVYKDDETRVYLAWNTSTYLNLLPIQITKTDKDGQVEESIALKNTVTPTKDAGNEPTGAETYANSDMASRTVMTYNDSGSVSNIKRYHTMAASGDGTRYTNYYQTDTEYDTMGRVEYTIEDVSDESSYDREQVTRHYYDFLGRQIKTAEAVSDNAHDIGAGKPTPTTTAEYFFDDPDTDAIPEQGDGDGNLRWVKQWFGTGASDYNNTEYRYDWRNRRGLTIPPLAPFTLLKYDHLDRVTATGRYSATTNLDPGDDPATTENTIRVDLSKTYFDERGRVYRTESYDDPAVSTPVNELASDTYYDRRGLVWASDPANTGISFTKYDGAGRGIQAFQGTQFDTAKYTSDAPDYPDDNEGIVQLTDYTLNDVGNATKIITKELNHDDTNGMNLTTSDYIRTYVYNWYDAAHRPTDAAHYGTNNASGWKDSSTDPNPGSVPTRSDTILVTSYTYDSEGHQEKVKDPKAIDTKSVYDKLGRVTQKEEDDGGGTERITSYQYNGQGSLTKITADLTVDQVTEYVYANTQNSRWVTKIKYPATDTANGKTIGQPSDETYDRIVFTYNTDGTLTTRTDQNGTVLTFGYNQKRQKKEEIVTAVGTFTGGAGAPDGAIRSFTWTYDSEGRAEYVTSHTDTIPDTSSWLDAANQVKYTYDSADKLTREEQEENGKVVAASPEIYYSYGTNYSALYYNRLDNITYPNSRVIWYKYTHSDATNTFQDTINDTFNRIGQIRRHDVVSEQALDNLAEYDFNGLGRQVRRVHDEVTSGADLGFGNDTRMDLWHGTSAQYDGLDRFGRIVDMRHVDFNGTATNVLQRKYTYDRNGNRLAIEDPLYKAESQTFTYDNLNRLTQQKRGLLLSGSISSNAYENFNMDLLGNFTASAGGVKVNATTSSVTQDVNATNEISTLDRPNPSGAKKLIDDPFDSLGSQWTQTTGTWSVASGELNVDTLSGGNALLLNSPTMYVANYFFNVKYPSGSSGRGGLVFSHDGNNNYYAVVITTALNAELYKITGGTWGSVLASVSLDGLLTGYHGVRVTVKGRHVEISAHSAISADTVFTARYDSATEFGPGLSGLYSNVANTKFSHWTVYESTTRDPKTRSVSGAGAASLISAKLDVNTIGSDERDVVRVDSFADDDYMVQADVGIASTQNAHLWVRFTDVDNGYRIWISGQLGAIELEKFNKGTRTVLHSGSHSGTAPTAAVKVKVSGTSIKVWVAGTLDVDVTDSAISYGGVAAGGDRSTFDNVKVGYDNNSDNDIDDAGDDLVKNEDFGGNSVTPVHDHAGNLVEDSSFRYTYDAWNRLVKVQAKEDGAAVTIQTAEFDALGRRIKKVVTNSGTNDKTEVYLYDDQKIIETRLGGAPNDAYQQFIHGTQYIDELVMVRVKDKGDLYVHQDANWNIIGTTDLGRHLVERNVYSPYGELTVDQKTGYGDRDGDGDVDSTDKGTVGTTCTGTVSGTCRILDLDFDGDYDASDATKFDSLPSGLQRTPGRLASAVQQPFAHQGLLFEPEIGSYQNRARQYEPAMRRFVQRDPLEPQNGLPLHDYLGNNPGLLLDPYGEYPVLGNMSLCGDGRWHRLGRPFTHIIATPQPWTPIQWNDLPDHGCPKRPGCKVTATFTSTQLVSSTFSPPAMPSLGSCSCISQGVRSFTISTAGIYVEVYNKYKTCGYSCPGIETYLISVGSRTQTVRYSGYATYICACGCEECPEICR